MNSHTDKPQQIDKPNIISQSMIEHLQTSAKWAGRSLVVLNILIITIILFVGFIVLEAFSLALVDLVIVFIIVTMIKVAIFLQEYKITIKELVVNHNELDIIKAQKYFRYVLKWIAIMSFSIGVFVSVYII